MENINVLYEFDRDLNIDKLELHLGENDYPTNAVIVYTTTMDETEKTANLNVSDNILALEAGNAFLTAEVTYDTLDSSSTSRKVLTASLHNYRKTIPAPHMREIKTIALSADSGLLDSSDDKLNSSDTIRFDIINEWPSLTMYSSISPTT